jgi:glutathione S-transferase
MPTMKLYYSSTSPYVRKVMICAHELGSAEAIETVPVKVTPIAPNADYAVRNPLMKVPALELPDGRQMMDSLVICEYLDSLGGQRLFPRSGDARWDALCLHALGDGMMDAALLARYELALRPHALRWDDWLNGQYTKVDNALDTLEAAAGSWGQSFLIGQIAVTCALGFLDFRFADRSWRTGRPALSAWFAAVAERESVRLTQPRV